MARSPSISPVRSNTTLSSYAPSYQPYNSYKSVAAEDEIELVGDTSSHTQSHHRTRGPKWRPNVRTLNPRHALETSVSGLNGYRAKQTENFRTWKDNGFKVNYHTIWINVREDIIHAPWKWLVRRFFSHVFPVITMCWLAALIAVMAVPKFTHVYADIYDVCDPDGSFHLSDDEYTPWKTDSFFSIQMSFGSFSFGLAKFVDISWDVGVGRGSQALLAIVSYKVFTKSLTRTLESSSVASETFQALTLQNDTFFGVVRIVKHFFRTGGARAKFAMAWTIISALFVLALPTWLSAMTGYIADISSFVADKSDNLVPANDFLPVIYTIHDGSRLGDLFTDDHRIALEWGEYNGVVLDYNSNYYGCYASPLNSSSDTAAYRTWIEAKNDDKCFMMWHVSEYVYKYGFLGLNETNTTFSLPDLNNITLASPSLNISASFAVDNYVEQWARGGYDSYWWYYPFAITWKDPRTNAYPYQTSNPLFYHELSDTLYNLTEINNKGSCQQKSHVRYRWGFSFLLLFAFVVTLLVWTIGMFLLYLDAYLNSRLDVAKRHVGLERAVMDLSTVMRKQLDEDQLDMSGNVILEKSVQDGQITYTHLPLQALPPSRYEQLRIWWKDFSVRTWAKDEKWWLAFLVIFTILFILSFSAPYIWYGWSYYFSSLPGFGIFWVLIAGRRVRARWVIFVLFFVAFWIGNTWWLATNKRRFEHGPYYINERPRLALDAQIAK